MNHVSIDPGSSITKAGWNDKAIQFPSVLTPSQPGDGICVLDSWWLVGEDAIYAQRILNTNPQLGAGYHGSDVQRVLICEALRRLGLGGEVREVDGLALGLPYDLARDVDLCATLTRSCRAFAWQTREGPAQVRTENVFIPPQGGGALYLHMSEREQHVPGEIVSVVDVGGQTADVVTAELGARMGEEQVIRAASQSVNVNVFGFYRMLVAAMKQQGFAVHREHDYHGLMARIRRGQFLIPGGPGGDTQDISGVLTRVRADWTASLQQAVMSVIGSRWMDVSTVIITGGGSHLVDPQAWQGPWLALDDMANVRGQLLALKGTAA